VLSALLFIAAAASGGSRPSWPRSCQEGLHAAANRKHATPSAMMKKPFPKKSPRKKIREKNFFM